MGTAQQLIVWLAALLHDTQREGGIMKLPGESNLPNPVRPKKIRGRQISSLQPLSDAMGRNLSSELETAEKCRGGTSGSEIENVYANPLIYTQALSQDRVSEIVAGGRSRSLCGLLSLGLADDRAGMVVP